MEGLTKMGCTHGAPSNASLELGPPFWRCAMVGVHPRHPVQRKPGTRTPFLALRYGWGAPTAPRPTQAWNSDPLFGVALWLGCTTAPRPTQAWNSDQPSLVWSDFHEPKKNIGRKTKKRTGAHRYPVLYVVHMYVSSARLMLIKTKPYHPHLAYRPVTWDLFVCHSPGALGSTLAMDFDDRHEGICVQGTLSLNRGNCL